MKPREEGGGDLAPPLPPPLSLFARLAQLMDDGWTEPPPPLSLSRHPRRLDAQSNIFSLSFSLPLGSAMYSVPVEDSHTPFTHEIPRLTRRCSISPLHSFFSPPASTSSFCTVPCLYLMDCPPPLLLALQRGHRPPIPTHTWAAAANGMADGTALVPSLAVIFSWLAGCRSRDDSAPPSY